MLSAEQRRIRFQQRNLVSPDDPFLGDSDTESDRAASVYSTTGKRIHSVDMDNFRRRLVRRSVAPTLMSFKEAIFALPAPADRSVSPALESYLNSSSDQDVDSETSELSQDGDSPALMPESQLTADSFNCSDDICGSTTISDVQSSLSMRTSASRPTRKDYASKILDSAVILGDMKTNCKCFRKTGSSCHSGFNYGEICQLRFERSQMDQTMEREVRISELKSALSHPDEMISVGGKLVPYKMCCIASFVIAFGLSKTSVARTVKQLRLDMPQGAIGRKKKSDADRVDDSLVGPLTAVQMHAQAWLRTWVEEEGDIDPTGNEQSYTVDMVEVGDVHKEYISERRFNSLTTTESQMSLRSFGRVWAFVMKDMRVHIRQKKNMTTKCSGFIIFSQLIRF